MIPISWSWAGRLEEAEKAIEAGNVCSVARAAHVAEVCPSAVAEFESFSPSFSVSLPPFLLTSLSLFFFNWSIVDVQCCVLLVFQLFQWVLLISAQYFSSLFGNFQYFFFIYFSPFIFSLFWDLCYSQFGILLFSFFILLWMHFGPDLSVQ